MLSQPDQCRPRLLRLPESQQHVGEPDDRVQPDALRQRVVGAMREGVPVDCQQRSHVVNALSSSIFAISRSVACSEAAFTSTSSEVGEVDRLTVGDPQRAQPAQAVGAGDRGRNERDARRERDPCGARMRPRLVSLAQALRLPRPFREHDHDLALSSQLGRRAHRLDISLAAPHLERAACAQHRRQHRVEELGFRHEPQLSVRKERHPQGPGVEVGRVIGREHQATLGHVLDARSRGDGTGPSRKAN